MGEEGRELEIDQRGFYGAKGEMEREGRDRQEEDGAELSRVKRQKQAGVRLNADKYPRRKKECVKIKECIRRRKQNKGESKDRKEEDDSFMKEEVGLWGQTESTF